MNCFIGNIGFNETKNHHPWEEINHYISLYQFFANRLPNGLIMVEGYFKNDRQDSIHRGG